MSDILNRKQEELCEQAPADYSDLRALFIASGRGIKRGATIEDMSTLDLAPTIARLLGLEMKDVEGKVRTDLLTEAVPAR